MGLYASENVRTRKRHACEYCTRTIEAGETALREHGVYDGTAFSRYACFDCVPLLDSFWSYHDNEVTGIISECFAEWRDEIHNAKVVEK